MKQRIINDITVFFQQEITNDPSMLVNPNDNILTRGLIDSMGIVRLIAYLQERYGIEEISYADMKLDNFRTIEKIASTFLRYCEQRSFPQEAIPLQPGRPAQSEAQGAVQGTTGRTLPCQRRLSSKSD